MALHTYLILPIDSWLGSIPYGALPIDAKVRADRLVFALDRNPFGDTGWRGEAHFGWTPGELELALWAARKLDNNGNCVVVSEVPLDLKHLVL